MKEYNEQVVETLDDAGCIIANKNIIIDNLQARIAELEEENELLKGRKNVELAADTDNAKSKQQRELAGPMEMGQLLAGSTHKTSGDLEIERTKPVTWIHKGGGFISDSRGKFIGCFSGDFRYRDRIICAVNSESETSKQLAAAQEEIEQLNGQISVYRLSFVELERQRDVEMTSATRWATGYHELRDQLAVAQEENGRLENQVLARDAELWGRTQEILGLKEQLAAAQLNNKLLREALEFLNARIVTMDLGGVVERALSLPASTEALDKYVAEKVKETYIPVTIDYGDGAEDVAFGNEHQARRLKKWLDKFFAQKEQIAALTRQHNLAVEALENCRLLAARHRKEEWAGHIMRFCKDAGLSGSPIRNDSIKESEGK